MALDPKALKSLEWHFTDPNDEGKEKKPFNEISAQKKLIKSM